MQAYARDRVTSVTWTDREVKAFTRVGVEPGERVEVMILVLAGDCTVVAARDAASSDRVSSIPCSAAAHASRTSAPPPSPSTTERALRHPLDGPGNAVMPGACERFTVSARDGTLHGLFARPGTGTTLRAAESPGRRTPPATGADPRTPVRRTGAG
ncbi:fibronectin type III-like domain-contianing protein [Streptomyces sp. NPDC013157]|uniref:fibronectin type III-like domain-contianing protein n=1 Tax=Streptomyces sp. NPDC013157 TaxID=3364861 RepID=UPI00367F0E6B